MEFDNSIYGRKIKKRKWRKIDMRNNGNFDKNGRKAFYTIPIDTMPGEIWTKITEDNIENIKPYYIVSNFGRIYNIYSEKYLTGTIGTGGYRYCVIRLQNNCKITKKFHRIVLQAFCPNIYKENYVVNHIDGNKLNNCVWNLEWCTVQENNIHAKETGLILSGTNHPRASVTEEQVNEICKLLEQGIHTAEIYKITGISSHIIESIKNKRTWTNISKFYNIDNTKILQSLSTEIVCEICKQLEQHIPDKIIMKNFNLPRYSLYRIKQRQTYTDISKNYYWEVN